MKFCLSSWVYILQIQQFKLTMKNQIDISKESHKQLIVNQNRHLKFSSYQPILKKAYSLRKVETYQPSFTPEIHDLPFQIYPERTKTQVSKQQIIQRLLDNKRDKAESMRAEKIRKDQKEVEICTFKPEISYQSKKMIEKDGRSQGVAFERLYQCGIQKMRSLHQNTGSIESNDKENCTFQPNIGDKNRRKPDLAPIYDRLHEIIAEKKQNMKALQQQRRQSEQRPTPQICFKSKQIIQKKSSFKKNVLDRLFDFMKEKNNKMENMLDKKEEKRMKQCTFQPEIGYTAEASQIEGDFLQRQEKEAIKLQQKMKSIEQNQKPSFVPQINKLSMLLVEAQRQGQTTSERLQRLQYEPLLQRQLQIQRIEQQIYRQCTFKPQINIISRALQGQPHSHKCNCHPKQQQYCFRPKINQNSKQMAHKHRSKNKSMITGVEQARKQMEYKEMKQCTFAPKILGQSYRSAFQKKSLDQIPGAKSYKERIDKMKDMKKKDEQLKTKMFQLQKRYQYRQQTKVEPFNLSKHQPKIQRLKQQAESQFKKHHPFRPQIIGKIR